LTKLVSQDSKRYQVSPKKGDYSVRKSSDKQKPILKKQPPKPVVTKQSIDSSVMEQSSGSIASSDSAKLIATYHFSVPPPSVLGVESIGDEDFGVWKEQSIDSLQGESSVNSARNEPSIRSPSAKSAGTEPSKKLPVKSAGIEPSKKSPPVRSAATEPPVKSAGIEPSNNKSVASSEHCAESVAREQSAKSAAAKQSAKSAATEQRPAFSSLRRPILAPRRSRSSQALEEATVIATGREADTSLIECIFDDLEEQSELETVDNDTTMTSTSCESSFISNGEGTFYTDLQTIEPSNPMIYIADQVFNMAGGKYLFGSEGCNVDPRCFAVADDTHDITRSTITREDLDLSQLSALLDESGDEQLIKLLDDAELMYPAEEDPGHLLLEI